MTTIPASIDATGTHDVTRELTEFLNSLPDRSKVTADETCRFRVDQGVTVHKPVGLDFAARGAVFFSDTDGRDVEAPDHKGIAHRWPRKRTLLRLTEPQGCRIKALRCIGPHDAAGPEADWFADLEAQHGIELVGGADTHLWNTGGGNVYGDFLYIGGGAEGTAVSGGVWSGAGRQGIAITWAKDTVIHGFSGRSIRRSCIDLEPPSPAWVVDGVHIEATDFTDFRLMWLPSNSSESVRVDNVTVINNTADRISVKSRSGSTGGRRANWRIENNRGSQVFGTSSTCMLFYRTDGLTVRGNHQPMKHGGTLRHYDCTAVDVSGNRWK